MDDWSSSFVYARSLKLSQSTGSELREPAGNKDSWLLGKKETLRQSQSLRKPGAARSAKDTEEMYAQLAEAGRDLDRGRCGQADYQKYVTAVMSKAKVGSPKARPFTATLGGRDEPRAEVVDAWNGQTLHNTKSHSARRQSAPARRARPFSAGAAVDLDSIDESRSRKPPEVLPMRRTASSSDTAHARRIHARSLKGREKALAWVERVARHAGQCANAEWDCEDEAKTLERPSSARQNERTAAPSRRRVLVEGAFAGCGENAVKEALAEAFGAVEHVEMLYGSQTDDSFVVRFREAASASAAAQRGWCALETRVTATPIPRGCDPAQLQKLLSRWGRVVRACELELALAHGEKARVAVLTFDSARSARAACGEHALQAAGAKTGALPGAGSNTGTAPRAGRPNQDQGRDALEASRRAASKGRLPPWHSAMEHRPFADNDMHSRQFGRSTSSTKDLNRKAAGTTHYHHTQATRRANAPHSTAKIHVGATMGATIGTTKLTVAPHKCTLKLKFF